MHVSFRNITAGLGLSVMMTAIAYAQSAGGVHVVNTPNVTNGAQSRTSGHGCCGSDPIRHNVTTPGVRNVAPHVVTGGSHSTTGVHTTSVHSGVSVHGAASNSSGVIIFNQGGLPVGETYASSVIDQLNVEGGEEFMVQSVTRQVPVTEQVCAPATEQLAGPLPIQAVCLDDKGAPHPASQTFEDEVVGVDQSGEVFRCLAGTSMQVTMGGYDSDGNVSFANGRTMACAKGEALFHQDGEITCRREEPRRNCNERSLLRRHGPGIKVLQAATPACVPMQRTVMKTVTEEVQVAKPAPAGGLLLSGGVGQGQY